jgi:GT2 family glycosyltransferase
MVAREAKDRISQLEMELRASQQQLATVLEILQEQQEQLTFQQSSLARLDRILMEMLTGRTWRTLRATGELVKRFVPSRASLTDGVSIAGGGRTYLKCDEPKAEDHRLRSGKVTVRGWCLAEHGVDLVQVEVAGLPQMETKPNQPRPDVRKALPDLDKTGRSGFQVEFDSSALPNGTHGITIRLVSKGKTVRQLKTSVRIDHEKGFASDYYRWIHEFERPADVLIGLKLPLLHVRPLISILMPVYNTQPEELKAAIQSVLDQSYENWELCIADDASSRAEVKQILDHFSGQDERIKVKFGTERGGIARTCNAAAQLASGDYLAFLDHDDTLVPHALAYVCETLDRQPEADLIYSDEDKIDAKGTRFEPFFKPDWSPDLLLSENYVCHLLVLRRDLATSIGHFNLGCDGSQDYDLILRATSAARHIEHIPRVLYHWRAGAASTASGIEQKSYAIDAAKLALERYCESRNSGMRVEPGTVPGRWRMRYPVPVDMRVSIIIASGGKVDILRSNIESIFGKTQFENYEVVVIDNSKGTSNVEKFVVSTQLRAPKPLRYIDWRNKPFNYSAINNEAARRSESPILLFLNDDTSVITPDWLTSMVELIAQPDVGAVGAKLLYPDGRIQHAGVVMGLFDNCGHAFKGLDGNASHYFDFSNVIRNVSAVTGACLMTKRDVFWQVGGFDDSDFAVAFNDIDLSLKIGSQGLKVLYTPHAVLYHYEAFSKTSKDLVPHPQEVALMRSKWEVAIGADPYYNPNLTRNDEDFSLRTKD